MTTHPEATMAPREIKPRIVIPLKDFEQLSLLARAAASRMPDMASVLTEELVRANVVENGRFEQFVSMGGQVEFRDDSTGKIQTVTLVYPGHADISEGRISVLTPIGAALIGLSVGDSITWETRTGETRQLTVLKTSKAQCLNLGASTFR